MKILQFISTSAFIAAAAVTRADLTHTFDSVPVTFGGYVDTYYVDDFADTITRNRQLMPDGVSPIYSHSRADRLAINQALLDAKIATAQFRGALGVQAGTYVQKNYAAENRIVQHIYEAQFGFKPAADA